jgi:DNA mismatch repair protein MutL
MLLATDEFRIQRLPQSVINKIAAGEVIERPASVVKELLENAVDALASRIEVDAEVGGAELIRVTDDGGGIHPDDVELAISAHATSKLRDADDLFQVQTMGFRGEALASIAEVSRFKLKTRQPSQLTGCEIDVEGGIVKAPRACGCPQGTSIEVRQLFLNTPVRRKFLRTAATEFAHIAEQFTRIALANPNLQLVLRHNGKTVFDLPASPRLLDRLELFYGSELALKLIPIEATAGESRLWGFVGHPSESRSTRKGQYLFLNGRWIQDRSLQHALGEAYRGLLMVGRYPVAFLFLEVPASEVDVNVHPTKSEVRFRDSSLLYRLLLSTLRTKFLGMDIASGHKLQPGASPEPSSPVDPARQLLAQQELVAWADQTIANWNPDAPLPEIPEYGDDETSAGSSSDAFGGNPSLSAHATSVFANNDSASQSIPPASLESAFLPANAAPASRPASADGEVRAMQVHDCYLVVETSGGLTVIDQHALHERILYEHFRERVLAGAVEVQRLLMPIPVELSPREAALILDQTELLASLGLLVESFGGCTVVISGYPTLMRRAAPAELVRAVIEQLEETDGKLSRRDLLDSLLHMLACKAAIKAGQRLAPEEIESLLAQRHLVDDAHHCPHGRPTALTFTRQDLDRQFGRLG